MAEADEWVERSEDEWRQQLSPEQFHVTRQGGTERPFTGVYHDCKESGTYVCICCGAPLFRSTEKYDSGSGWPSYWSPVGQDAVAEHRDASLGRVRTEIRCSRCAAHLGHVFDDGPKPTGLRYCVNSASLLLEQDINQEGNE